MKPNKNFLTGIGKIFNGRKYDFPIDECIRSVLEGASSFILVVCDDSEDDTVPYCQALERRWMGRLKLLYDKWRVSPTENHTNMVRLANKAIDAVTSEWYWSLDMDEIVPVGESFKLANFLKGVPHDVGCAMVKFNHLYATLDRQIYGKLYDTIHRVARKSRGWRSGMDGCGLQGGTGRTVQAPIFVNHYGYVREIGPMLEKEIRFQQELYCGEHGLPDERLLKAKAEGATDKIAFYDSLAVTDRITSYMGPKHQPYAIEWYNKITGQNK